jgi:hypothetical protein
MIGNIIETKHLTTSGKARSPNISKTSPPPHTLPLHDIPNFLFPAISVATAIMSPSVTRPLNLDTLPDELILKILEKYLPNSRDLCAMCLVSKRLNKIADPVLYKSILFEQPAHHLKFSESLASTRPRRGSLILNVRLEYPGHANDLGEHVRARESSMSPVDSFSHTISTMSNLETLVISVPASLAHGIGHLFNHPFALACLKWCM